MAVDDATQPLLALLSAAAKQRKQRGRDRAELLERRAGWQASQPMLDKLETRRGRAAANLDTPSYDEQRDLPRKPRVTVTPYPRTTTRRSEK